LCPAGDAARSSLAAAGGTAFANCTPVPGTLQSDGTYQNGSYCHIDLVQDLTSLGYALANYFGTTGEGLRPCSLGFPSPPEDGRVYDYATMQATYTLTGRQLVQSTDGCQTGNWHSNGCTSTKGPTWTG
jgi:hypothetical protein